jgi:hypothetical protein
MEYWAHRPLNLLWNNSSIDLIYSVYYMNSYSFIIEIEEDKHILSRKGYSIYRHFLILLIIVDAQPDFAIAANLNNSDCIILFSLSLFIIV